MQEICKNLSLKYISQATKSKIKNEWNIDLSVDKSSRQYDFAINNNGRLVLMETNFFLGGGSKLKSVAGEFTALNDYLKDKDTIDKSIWITDGIGWETSQKPLNNNLLMIIYVFKQLKII
ncbi:DpnII family type II restriction endonuclease [Proteiniborus sp. MB09-C3]|uniref:DpnII family type II restriction endonuclease n=1 Tax=Proteiniborus sp. MB09-C3 TaxID=3050072 RepID=UPI002554EADB|nr:DpnII family type II restriction endonuclease [Proteiniborus sp. MB09-C3]WIV13278.1 DpnII family type II restriction endonuclease [Proteiniborus sp. MB09-C3]